MEDTLQYIKLWLIQKNIFSIKDIEDGIEKISKEKDKYIKGYQVKQKLKLEGIPLTFMYKPFSTCLLEKGPEQWIISSKKLGIRTVHLIIEILWYVLYLPNFMIVF